MYLLPELCYGLAASIVPSLCYQSCAMPLLPVFCAIPLLPELCHPFATRVVPCHCYQSCAMPLLCATRAVPSPCYQSCVGRVLCTLTSAGSGKVLAIPDYISLGKIVVTDEIVNMAIPGRVLCTLTPRRALGAGGGRLCAVCWESM